MKIFKLFALLSFTINFAFAHSLSDIAGTYELSSSKYPHPITVTLTKNGKILFKEVHQEGAINCVGEASIKDNMVHSSLACDNGETFNQNLNLTLVKKITSNFTAPVYSSALDLVIVMDFKKVM